MLPRRCSGSLYEALHVTKDASASEIKKAYYRLALQFHPDKTGGATTEEFKKIQEANAILSDSDLRKKYDTFGREGMQQLNSLGIPSEFLSAVVIRLILVATSILSLLFLIFVSLVVAKLDRGHPSASWAVVWTPLWLVTATLAVSGLTMIAQGAAHRSLEMVLLGAYFVLLLIVQAVFVSGLQGGVPMNRTLVVLFLLYFTELGHAVYTHRFDKFKELHVMMGDPEASEMDGPCHAKYLKMVALTAVHKILNFSVLVLLALRCSNPHYASLSFFSVAAPWFLLIALSYVIGLVSIITASEASCKKRILGVVFLSTAQFPVLYTLAMIAAKLDAEVNGTGGYDPSAGVCCIFIFIAVGLLTVASCIGSCCIRFDEMDATAHYEDGRQSKSQDNGNGEDANPGAASTNNEEKGRSDSSDPPRYHDM